ncbi:GntR family transcriptional regulator [Nocardioides lentus]|uniref:GntR family transcriptional regulator n=1 Tax=Nocardioides lentus TaxID=338077 RepID=A0ABP5AB19_9ACTN
MRDHALTELRRAIVDGTLEPGERLLDAELTAWLGVSRTPVREALARLVQMGLVRVTPGRGTVVAPLDDREASEAQTVAASLHAQAARDAVPVVTDADLVRMSEVNDRFAEALDAADVEAALEADDHFHAVFVDLAGNRVLAGVLSDVTPLLRRMERARFASLSGRRSVSQHRRIVELARSGDVEACAAEVRANWMTLRPVD